MKKFIIGGFIVEFCALMLFYGYAYPIIPFWGDDFQLLSVYPSLLPVSGSWIPARLLPLYIQTNIGAFASYVIAPLTHLDFLDSIAIASGVVLSSAFVGLHIVLYMLSFMFVGRRSYAMLISSIFILGCVALAKSDMMPLLLPADLNAQGMGYLLTMVCFYTLPYLLNLSLVVGIIFVLVLGQNVARYKALLGGGHYLLFTSRFFLWRVRALF